MLCSQVMLKKIKKKKKNSKKQIKNTYNKSKCAKLLFAKQIEL